MDENGVVIFFSSGKLRVMGCNDDLDATFLAYKYTTLIPPYKNPEILLQSMTVKVLFGHCLNLVQLQILITPSILELEIFPALQIQKYKPISVNIFTTGNVILCGVKKMDDVDYIINKLTPLIHLFKV